MNYSLLLKSDKAHSDNPSYRAIAGVLDAASTGMLPRFAQWLGLAEQEYWGMLDHCFPNAWGPNNNPLIVVNDTVLPCEFQELVNMLMADCSSDAPETKWLAYALACGCFGGHHLWHDMGLSGRDDVCFLLKVYFRPIFDANIDQMKWKKFFYHRICEQMDLHPYPVPIRTDCDDYSVCYGSEEAITILTGIVYH